MEPKTSDSPADPQPRTRNRLLARRLLALGLGLGSILLLEALAALLGVDPAPIRHSFSFAGRGPLLERTVKDGHELWRPAAAWFGGMRYYSEDIAVGFRVPKPAGTMRIFCLGGSSTAGYPFGPRVAFGRRLGLMLDHLDPSTRHQVINLGVNGASSNQLVRQFPQVIAADPDLIIIYVGHNDCMLAHRPRRLESLTLTARRLNMFFGRSRLYRLAASVFRSPASPGDDDPISLYYANQRKAGELPRNDHFFYPPEDRRGIGPRLEKNLRTILDLADRSHVPVILCTVEANRRDEPPEGSVHGRRLSPEQARDWNDHFLQAEQEFRAGNLIPARQNFAAAAEIDPDFAFLNYRLGQLALLAGDREEADQRLTQAIENADLPRRALGVVNEVIRDLGRKGAMVADVESAFSDASANGAPGYDWFLDGMHPNRAGHRLIAEVILRAMIARGMIAAGEDGFAAAVAGADRAIEPAPEFLYENYFFLATEQEYLGRIQRALWLSRKALQARPNDEVTRVMMIERMETKYQGLDTWE